MKWPSIKTEAWVAGRQRFPARLARHGAVERAHAMTARFLPAAPPPKCACHAASLADDAGQVPRLVGRQRAAQEHQWVRSLDVAEDLNG